MPRISQARQREVRGRILAAGLRVFETEGFRRASMQAVASEAGLSIGAIYTYFASKEDLFLAAFNEMVAEEERQLEERVLAASTMADRVAIGVGYWVDLGVMRDQPGFRGSGGGFLLHAWAHADELPEIRAALVRRREHVQLLGRLIVRDAVAHGELPVWTDVDGLAAGIFSMLDGLFVQRAERGSAFDHEDAVRQVTAIFRAVLASVAAADPPDVRLDHPTGDGREAARA